MEYIETGTTVTLIKHGLKGLIHKVFDNFDSIGSDFLWDKINWLKINGYSDKKELLNGKWISVDCFDGGQSLHPISEIKF